MKLNQDSITEINRKVGVVLSNTERVLLGPRASYELRHDPRHLVFVLSRYKFVSKLLANKGYLMEVGIGDGLGATLVAQAGNTILGLDIEPVGIDRAADIELTRDKVTFALHDMVKSPYRTNRLFDAAYSIDVIEHIPIEFEENFMKNIVETLNSTGCLILGSPNKSAERYASKEAKSEHVNLKTHEDLLKLMSKYFHNVFMFGMNDEVVHTGYSEMCHYLFALGVQKRTIVR